MTSVLFGRIIPFDAIRGRRVLEIGCGMGLHTETLVRAGADVTTIDISETSVDATARRLAIKGLKADVRRMDAEILEFPDASFDFVWSWGVIHHSAMTGRIVRQIDRVLKAGGELGEGVESRGDARHTTMARRYMTGFWRGRSLDECLWRDTDGFTARYYSRDQLADRLIFFLTRFPSRASGRMRTPRRCRGVAAYRPQSDGRHAGSPGWQQARRFSVCYSFQVGAGRMKRIAREPSDEASDDCLPARRREKVATTFSLGSGENCPAAR